MVDSSPIESWEGAGAVFNSAGRGGVMFWRVIAAALGIIPIISAIRHENAIENKHG
jgi:hypothetical protein